MQQKKKEKYSKKDLEKIENYYDKRQVKEVQADEKEKEVEQRLKEFRDEKKEYKKEKKER